MRRGPGCLRVARSPRAELMIFLGHAGCGRNRSRLPYAGGSCWIPGPSLFNKYVLDKGCNHRNMTTLLTEDSVPKSRKSRPAVRPLTRKQMHHQRLVEWRKPGRDPVVGMLLYRPAADDEHAKWIVQPRPYGGVLMERVPWPAVEAGEFFRTPPRVLSIEDERTLARWFRRELAERA